MRYVYVLSTAIHGDSGEWPPSSCRRCTVHASGPCVRIDRCPWPQTGFHEEINLRSQKLCAPYAPSADHRAYACCMLTDAWSLAGVCILRRVSGHDPVVGQNGMYAYVYVGLPSRPAPISANAPIKNPFVDPGLRVLVRGCSRSSRPRRLAQLGCVTSRRSAEGRRATLRERMCKVV